MELYVPVVRIVYISQSLSSSEHFAATSPLVVVSFPYQSVASEMDKAICWSQPSL